jgi:hypothetical protein
VPTPTRLITCKIANIFSFGECERCWTIRCFRTGVGGPFSC